MPVGNYIVLLGMIMFRITESVRKYPTLPMLNRICTEDYHISHANYTIPKGTPVVISLLGLGRDPKYFPQPERYWPDRFEDDVRMFNESAFIPFGDGPRQCIGEFSASRSACFSSVNEPSANQPIEMHRFTIGKNDCKSGARPVAAVVRF